MGMRERVLARKVVFGRSIPVFAIALVAVTGLASAALVSYLSNTINATVEVSSPFRIWFLEDSTEYETLTFNPSYGGETISYETHVENRANTEIQVYRVIHEITGPAVWSGEEFTSVYLEDPRYGTDVPGEILEDLCHVKDDGTAISFASIDTVSTTKARLIYSETGCNNINKYTHDKSGDTDDEIINDISITLAPGIASGTYTVKLCHLDNLAGSCAV